MAIKWYLRMCCLWYIRIVCSYMHICLCRFNSVFIMEYPDDLNPKNMITGFICYVDEILIHCLQVSAKEICMQALYGEFAQLIVIMS